MRALMTRAMSLSREELRRVARSNFERAPRVPTCSIFMLISRVDRFSQSDYRIKISMYKPSCQPVSSHARWIQDSRYTIHTTL